MQTGHISKTEIKGALLRSGYLSEGRVAKVLIDNQYFVQPNVAFQDPETKKSRELDVYANYRASHFRSEFKIFVTTRLAVEVIHPPQPIVFFGGRSMNLSPLLEKMRFASTPIYDPRKEHFVGQLQINSFHGVTIPSRSTQYCSFSKKKPGDHKTPTEWMASHSDDLHDTFKKLLQFTDLKMIEQKDAFLHLEDNIVRLIFFQPLLVVQETIFLAEGLKRSVRLKKVPHVVFEFNYHYSDQPSTILIDVITERYLPSYLNIIKDEAEDFGQQIHIINKGPSTPVAGPAA